MFLDYLLNNKEIKNNSYYEHIFNIIAWLSDKANSVKNTIQCAVEKELHKRITEEEISLEKMIKVIKSK